MTMNIAMGVLLVAVIISAGYLLVFAAGRKRELLAMATSARENSRSLLEKLKGLSCVYWTDKVVDLFERNLYEAQCKEVGARPELLESLIVLYGTIGEDISRYVNNPEGTLLPKFFDPITDTPLTEPTDLILTHPVKGDISLVVNRSTKIAFMKHGPQVFSEKVRRNRYTPGNRYRIMGAGYGRSGAFWQYDIIDSDYLYGLLVFGDDYMRLRPFVGGGGVFLGGGATFTDSNPWPEQQQLLCQDGGYWSRDAQDATVVSGDVPDGGQPSSGQTASVEATVAHDEEAAMPEPLRDNELAAEEEYPLIVDPFEEASVMPQERVVVVEPTAPDREVVAEQNYAPEPQVDEPVAQEQGEVFMEAPPTEYTY